MGNIVDKKKKESIQKKPASYVKSKGERLGWESIKDYQFTPLKEIIGKGALVKSSPKYQSNLLVQ